MAAPVSAFSPPNQPPSMEHKSPSPPPSLTPKERKIFRVAQTSFAVLGTLLLIAGGSALLAGAVTLNPAILIAAAGLIGSGTILLLLGSCQVGVTESGGEFKVTEYNRHILNLDLDLDLNLAFLFL
jgi:hypothetical protein